MQDDEFEWDDEKARTNLAKHGVSFERATLVFEDPLLVDEADLEHDAEERSKAIGMAGGRLLAESLRREATGGGSNADRHEHDDYYRSA